MHTQLGRLIKARSNMKSCIMNEFMKYFAERGPVGWSGETLGRLPGQRPFINVESAVYSYFINCRTSKVVEGLFHI